MQGSWSTTEEKRVKEINDLATKKLATEEKYGRVFKEKKLLEEKERILINAFDSIKELSDLKKKEGSKETTDNNMEDQ